MVVALAAAHWSSLGNSFQYDDFHSIVDNPHISRLSGIPRFFTTPEMFSVDPARAMPRPLLLVTYALNYRIHADEVRGYRVVNLALHGLATGLVYGLTLQLGGVRVAAAAAAMLFALHPVNVEAATYISSRSESLAACFVLAALVLYLRARQAVPRRLPLLTLSVACFAGGLMSKSSAIVLPVLLATYEGWRRTGLRGDRIGAYTGTDGHTGKLDTGSSPHDRDYFPLTWLTPYLLVALAYLVVNHQWLAGSLGEPVRPFTVQLWTQIKAGAYYLQLLFMPVALSVEHGFSASVSPLQPPVLASLLLLLSLTAVVARAGGRAALLFVWAVLALLPASLTPLNVLVNEHRLYVPLAAVATAAGLGLQQARRLDCGGLRTAGAFAGMMAIMVVLTYLRTAVWKDEMTLWTDAVRRGAGMYRAHMHLGGAYERQGDTPAALEAYRRATELAPGAVEPWYNLGNALRVLGDLEGAAHAYRQALQRNPDSVSALVNLAALLTAAGQLDEADRLLHRALTVNPSIAVAHLQLGVLRRRQRRDPEAAVALEDALRLEPGMAEAHFNLGNLLFDSGDFRQAAQAYRLALDLRPDYGGAYLNLADLYLGTGAATRAVELLQQGVRHAPGEPRLWFMLGQAQEHTGQLAAARSSYQRFLDKGAAGPAAEAARARLRALR